MKKERSRAYPLVDLQAADEILRGKLLSLGVTPVSRDVLAKALGYSSAEGGIAARKIGALVQYGLVDRRDKLYKISLLGLRLQGLAVSTPEFLTTIRTALERPVLFRQVLDRYRPAGLLPENLAEILTQDYGITTRASEDAEGVFIRSAWFAGVLDPKGRFQETPLSPAPTLQELTKATPTPGQKPLMEFALTSGKVSKLEFPPEMTAEDMRRLEKRLRFELDEGSLWEFVGLKRPAEKPTENTGEGPTKVVVPFGNRPGNQAS